MDINDTIIGTNRGDVTFVTYCYLVQHAISKSDNPKYGDYKVISELLNCYEDTFGLGCFASDGSDEDFKRINRLVFKRVEDEQKRADKDAEKVLLNNGINEELKGCPQYCKWVYVVVDVNHTDGRQTTESYRVDENGFLEVELI